MTTPTEALEIIKTYNGTSAIRQAFPTLGAYIEYRENPQSTPFTVINDNGNISVVDNKNFQLSPDQALVINKNWKNSAIQAEFGSFPVYLAYMEAQLSGKVNIIGRDAKH